MNDTQIEAKAATQIQLTPQQEEALGLAADWLDTFDGSKPYFVLSGYAGTGKTFSIRYLIEKLHLRARFMAYTGKAALVLSKSIGQQATTIHSAVYKYNRVADAVFQELYQQRDQETDDVKKAELNAKIQHLMVPKFTLNTEAFECDTPDLIVLDECSMVDDEILGDLLSFGIPIIALGDPGQLPPPTSGGSGPKEGALFRGAPDYLLTDIRRQALDSPIIKWSMWARQGRPFPRGQLGTDAPDAECFIKPMLSARELNERLLDNDIVICWRNKTLQQINMQMRKLLGHASTDPIFPVVGERIVIRQNDREKGLFNGMFAEVISVEALLDFTIELWVRTETMAPDEEPIKISILRACFEEYQDGKEAWDKLRSWNYRGNLKADYGYAITCHRAQGSQWDKVLVFDDNVLKWPAVREERKKWLYTAVTRAVERVQIIDGK